MGIILYDDNNRHGGGFSGYRVTRTIGSEAVYRQRYFSFNYYGEQAQKLAQALDAQWAKEANLALRRKHIRQVTQLRLSKCPQSIVYGLRAAISVERKFRGHEMRAYFSPCFYVKIPGYGRSDKSFRIRKWGFNNAYTKAALHYSDIHDLDSQTRLSLLAKRPDKALFIDNLLPKIKARGHKLTKKALMEILG